VAIEVKCDTCAAKFRTDDSAAGKQTACPKCGGVIRIPMLGAEPEVYEAEESDFDAFSDDELAGGPPAEVPEGDDRKPCPMCGEYIVRDAVKCRFCGEIFDPTLKKKAKKKAALEDEDSVMTTGDWLVAILCSGIGCILGIIYIVQGKPKGTKILLISLGMQAFWFAIRVALEASM